MEVAAYPVDLQLHSTASDGTDTPAELVQLALQRGLRVIALTDHDTVLGIEPALAAAGERLRIVPALEFSTLNEPERDYFDLNFLGLGIRHHDPALQTVLQQVLESRIEQKVRQIEKLQTHGVDVPVEEVLRRVNGVPGRVHIAQVALERNPDRFTSIGDVFAQYLATDAPNSVYVKRTFSLTVEDAIDLCHTAGGIAVLAHPGAYPRVHDMDAVVRRLAQQGLDAIEVRYPYGQNRGHYGASAAEVARYVAHFDALADELRLLKSGGSDYHGQVKPGIQPGDAGLTWDEWEALAAVCGW